jgi:hypothetical protein
MNNYIIQKRTFEALNYPKGSKERDYANLSITTSEYQLSYKYCVLGIDCSVSFRTRKEANDFAGNNN